MKLLSKCKPVGSTLVVAASLELLTGSNCTSCNVTSSGVVGGLAMIGSSDSVTFCGMLSVIGVCMGVEKEFAPGSGLGIMDSSESRAT
ncbi:hypothetical protein Hanom_Chr12g01083881 [Helianthus anomalus]